MRSRVTLGILVGLVIVGAILVTTFYSSASQPLPATSPVTTIVTDVSTLKQTTTHTLTEEKTVTQTETTEITSESVEPTTVTTADLQPKTSTVSLTLTVAVTSATEASATPEALERIIIALPFDPENPPTGLQPMGETINHDVKYGGHPGIDFQWYSDEPPKFYASAKGVIVELRVEENSPGDWTMTLSHIGFDKAYYTRYGLTSPNTDLKVGTEVEKHTFLGYVPNPHPEDNMYGTHWEFGLACVGEQCEYGFGGDRLCPMTYFDEDSRELIEKIWDAFQYPHKDQFPHICSGFYYGMDE